MALKLLKIDEETHKKIKMLAVEEDKTMTAIISQAVNKYLEEKYGSKNDN